MSKGVDWDAAEIAMEKFTRYSMDPDNPNANRKWEAFRAIGFYVDEPDDREQAAVEVVRQIRATLPPRPPPPISRLSDYGNRYETTHTIQGPNGRKGELEVVWQVDSDTTHPRLVTNYLRVHKEPQR